MQGLGFGVQHVGCRVYGLGFWFRVSGSGIRVWDLGFGVEGLGFRVKGSRLGV